MTKMAKIDTLFMDKLKRLKTTPVEAAHTYLAHIREHPPSGKCLQGNALLGSPLGLPFSQSSHAEGITHFGLVS